MSNERTSCLIPVSDGGTTVLSRAVVLVSLAGGTGGFGCPACFFARLLFVFFFFFALE